MIIVELQVDEITEMVMLNGNQLFYLFLSISSRCDISFYLVLRESYDLKSAEEKIYMKQYLHLKRKMSFSLNETRSHDIFLMTLFVSSLRSQFRLYSSLRTRETGIVVFGYGHV